LCPKDYTHGELSYETRSKMRQFERIAPVTLIPYSEWRNKNWQRNHMEKMLGDEITWRRYKYLMEAEGPDFEPVEPDSIEHDLDK